VDAKQFTMSITFSNVVEHPALEYFEQYKENKRRCGRTEIIFPAEEKEYIEKDQLKVGPQTSLLAVQSEPSLVQ
jgi:hypothetical protein